jgi:membrane protease YdiL (CAAX protease family)
MFNVKEAPWKVILVQLLVGIVMASVINLVLFPGPFFGPITRATGGLIDGTLQANVLSILLFSLIVFGWGKLRPRDVGLDWSKLGQALSLTALLWLAMQLIVLIVNWINGDVHMNPLWSERGVTAVLGGLIAQLAGNAFYEEMSYRGFYLQQFYLKIRNPSERGRKTVAILSMLGLFVLSHIPNRIFHGYTLADIPLDFALLFAWGLFFTAIYLVSGNLFLAIGVHALTNRPTLITESPFPAQALLFVLTCILLAALRRRSRALQQQAITP